MLFVCASFSGIQLLLLLFVFKKGGFSLQIQVARASSLRRANCSMHPRISVEATDYSPTTTAVVAQHTACKRSKGTYGNLRKDMCIFLSSCERFRRRGQMKLQSAEVRDAGKVAASRQALSLLTPTTPPPFSQPSIRTHACISNKEQNAVKVAS